MKLVLNGHDERYVVEQSLMALFPGELPVYEPICPGDDDWAVVTLAEEAEGCRITVELALGGKSASRTLTVPLSGTDFEKEGQRRHAMARCFFLAARDVTGATPPWGMLTGVRPDKPVTWALAEGKSPEEARKMLEKEYFVTPERSALALETGETALRAIRRLSPRDIDIYVGIPFCPTRCVYCSFVSQSVEKSFALVPPYVEALAAELRAGGEMIRRAGLRVRSFYMGGGTPTTLTAEQMDTVLTALESSFDLTDCTERTVEAGRPDTITPEKLAVLRSHGVDRVSVNPQTLEDRVPPPHGGGYPPGHGPGGPVRLRPCEYGSHCGAAGGHGGGLPPLPGRLPHHGSRQHHRPHPGSEKGQPHPDGGSTGPRTGDGDGNAGLRRSRPARSRVSSLLPLPAKIHVRQL